MKIISNLNLNKGKKIYVFFVIITIVLGVLLHFMYNYFREFFFSWIIFPRKREYVGTPKINCNPYNFFRDIIRDNQF